MLTIDLFSEGAKGVHAELSWLLYALMGLFLLTIIVGWLSSSRKASQAEVKSDAPGPVSESGSNLNKAGIKTPVKNKSIKTK